MSRVYQPAFKTSVMILLLMFSIYSCEKEEEETFVYTYRDWFINGPLSNPPDKFILRASFDHPEQYLQIEVTFNSDAAWRVSVSPETGGIQLWNDDYNDLVEISNRTIGLQGNKTYEFWLFDNGKLKVTVDAMFTKSGVPYKDATLQY